MVKLLASENVDLAEHIRKCKENRENCDRNRNQATFLSSNFVNKTLLIIRRFLVSEIVHEIKRNGGCFGLLMDASQDITSKEQFSVVARYVNDNKDVVERTILFFEADDTSGEAIYNLLQAKLSEIGLSISNIVGSSFDGASNMRSQNIGLSALIQQNVSKSIYTWCLSHRFNLVMKKAIGSSGQITSVLDLAEDSATLFRASYLRMNIWTDVIKTTPNISSARRLKIISKTRWSSAQDAVSSIINTDASFFVLIKSLLKVCNLKNLERAALVNASNILNSWMKYENVAITFILNKIFLLTSPTTKFLQKCGLNFLSAIDSLRTLRENLEVGKKLIATYIEDADEFIGKVNNLLSKDEEIVGLSCNCCIKLPTEDEKQEINSELIIIFEKYIEKLQFELDERILIHFDDPQSIYHEISILDPRNAEKIFSNEESEVHMKKLCDVNNILNENRAIEELRTFATEFLSYQNRPQLESILENNSIVYSDCEPDEGPINYNHQCENDVEEITADTKNVEFQLAKKKICYCCECILKFISNNASRMKRFESIYKIYRYVAMLPMTQVKCERDFSKMKITKNRLRASLSEKSLENLMIISTECDMFENINLESIIDLVIASSLSMAKL